MPPLPPAPRRSPLALAGRLTWGALAGPALDPSTASLIASGLGGVVLFERNVVDPAQVAALVAAMRCVAPWPLHVAVDQEGGHVLRVGEPLTRFPSAMALGATGSPEIAFEVARASALELRGLGIDVVLAPVLDVASEPANPVVGARSLGDDPALVAPLGAAMVRGYLAGGLIPVPKHFPGHGRTALDSHRDAPLVEGGMRPLRAIDLPPFAAAVAAGAPALMIGHVAYRGLGRAGPASLEPAAYRLARRDLGFRGATVTDALIMDAITARGTVEGAAVESIAAGADVVMALDPARRTVDALAAAIASHRIAPGRIEQAQARADRLAAASIASAVSAVSAGVEGRAPEGVPSDIWPRHALPDGAARLDAHRELAAEVASRSLTLVEDRAGLLPIEPSTAVCLIEVGSGRVSPIEDEGANRTRFARPLGRRLARLDARWVPAGDTEAASIALAAAGSSEVAIVATRDAFALDEDFGRMLALSLRHLGRPLVHVALRAPADLAGSAAGTRIAAYADVPATLEALADALVAGPQAFPGRLPAAIQPDPDEAVA